MLFPAVKNFCDQYIALPDKLDIIMILHKIFFNRYYLKWWSFIRMYICRLNIQTYLDSKNIDFIYLRV